MDTNVELIGLDNGYSHTKDNSGTIFRSAYTKDSVAIGKKFVIDGISYQVGSGNMTSDIDKTDAEINKVCTLYNLAINHTKDVILSVGLPIAQYKMQKEKLKENILLYNKCHVSYAGEDYKVAIKNVIVNPQGLSSLYSVQNFKFEGEYIVIDIGGLTIDSCLVECSRMGTKIMKCDTWYKGMRTLYSDIISETNNKFNTKLENINAEDMLKTGYVKIKGNIYTLEYLKHILQSYIDQISEELKLKYPYETVPIYLVGGGSGILYEPFSRRFNDVNRVINGQFSNAIGYYNIACVKLRR